MSLFSFTKQWKPFEKGFYFTLLVFLTGVAGIQIWLTLSDDPYSIPWIIGSTTETLVKPLATVTDSFIDFPISGNHYFIKEFYLAKDYVIDTTWIYLFLALFGLALTVLVTVSTFMSRMWYWVTTGFLIILLTGFQPEQLLLFGWTGKLSLGLIILIYVVPSFVFNSFAKAAPFLTRLLTFTSLTTLVVFLIQEYSGVSLPFLYLASYGFPSFLFLCLIFVAIVGHEIIYGILYLSTYAKAGIGNNRLSFILLSVIYLLNLVLVYLRNIGAFDLDIIYVNTIALVLISTVIGFWGFKRKEQVYQNVFSFNPYGAWLYISLATCFLAFSTLMIYVGNDPAVEVLEDAVVFSHIGFGSAFLVYILINFGSAIKEQLPVYKIAFKERHLPYFSTNLAGLVIAYVLYANSGGIGYYQSFAGYYNMLGDLYNKEGKTFLADQYFLESSVWASNNHKANYSLARLSLKSGKTSSAINAYKEATKKKPTPQVFVNLAKLYEDQGKFFESFFTLKEGLKVFPANQKISNNLALQYQKIGMADSAMMYLNTSVQTNDAEHTTLMINKGYIAGKFGLALDKDSLVSTIATQNNQAVISNLIAYKNIFYPETRVELQKGGNFFNLNPYSAAYLNNLLVHDMYVDSDDRNSLLAQLDEALSNPANRDYHKNLEHVAAINAYYNGEVSNAFDMLRKSSANYLSLQETNNRLLGLWSLEQYHPFLAKDYLAVADADIALLLAQLNSAEQNVITKTNPDADSLKTSLLLTAYNTGFSSLLSSSNDTIKYLGIKYRYKQQDTELIKTLLATITNDPLKLRLTQELVQWKLMHGDWNSVNELAALLPENTVLKSDIDAITTMMQDERALNPTYVFQSKYYKDLNALLKSSMSTDSTDHQRIYEFGIKNPFNIPQVLIAVKILDHKNQELAYKLILKSSEINSYSVALSKAYINQAIKMNLLPYAEEELERISFYMTSEEYRQNQELISVKKTLEAMEDTDW